MKNDLPLQPLTIFLLRKGASLSHAITQPNLPSQSIQISDGATASLITPLPEPSPPKWADFLRPSFVVPDNLLSQSARAILHIKHGDDSFVLTFGHSYHLIDQAVIERNFGLKVVLNEVPSDKIRSIDRTSLQSDPLQSRTQASKSTDIYRFGIDVERDLLSAATGEPTDYTFGKRLSGADALHVSIGLEMKHLPVFLKKCLQAYRKKAYQKIYPWFDNIQAVESEVDIDDLNKELDKVMQMEAKSSGDQVALIVPKVIDWTNIKGFYYASYRKKLIYHPELYFKDWIAYLDGTTPSVELAKRGRVFAFADDTNNVIDNWRLYNCLSTELSADGKVFLLHDGQWFKLSTDLVEEIDSYIDKRTQWPKTLPAYPGYGQEKDYNALVAKKEAMFLLDRKNISHGGGHSKIEACDLLSRRGDMIHVKRLSSGSSGLSHLFTQAVVGTELILRDKEFREKVIALIPKPDRIKMAALLKNRSNLTIVAAICKAKTRRNIPFFGRIALRNMLQRFDGMGVKAFYKIV